MKICIFSRPFYPDIGGLEQIAKTLAYEFSYSNHDVEVVTDTKNFSQDDKKFLFKITRTSSFKERYTAFRRADVVLFMNFTFAGVPVAVLARRPIVLSHHIRYHFCGSLKTQFIEFMKGQLTRFFLNICVSNFLSKNLPGKSVVAPNAFDNILFRYDTSIKNNDFVFCGRLVSDKGVDILLDACKIVFIKYPDSTLTIIGNGPEWARLYEQSNSTELFGKINFTGILQGQKLANKLKEHSCMVIPSLWEEPFGIVALEGIASCDTVISSNRGGLPEAVGDCGILIEPTVNNLVKAMTSVLESRKNNKLLPGQPTIEQRTTHLAKHSPKQVAQIYIDVCREAIRL